MEKNMSQENPLHDHLNPSDSFIAPNFSPSPIYQELEGQQSSPKHTLSEPSAELTHNYPGNLDEALPTCNEAGDTLSLPTEQIVLSMFSSSLYASSDHLTERIPGDNFPGIVSTVQQEQSTFVLCESKTPELSLTKELCQPERKINPEEIMQKPEETKQRRSQAYFEFKEKIGRLTTSVGDSFAGDMLAVCSKEFADTSGNYLRGCKWSPDGSMLLTNSNDNYMRTFQIHDAVISNQWNVNTEMCSSLKVLETDAIFDFCWFPAMTLTNPDSCLFATTCRETPIHMFSALTGKLICSYRPYNHVDEIVAAHSIGFTSDGRYLVSGFNKQLRCFDTNRPGRECTVSSTVVKEKDNRGRTVSVQGQRAILSCFAAHPTSPSLVAAGAFNGDVAIYDIPSGSMTTMFEGQSGGITHLVFSQDGNYLFAGGRKDPEINCFDIRNPEKVLYVLYRYVATNQRMYFDLDWSSRYLLSGNHNGKVSVWDLKGESHIHESPYTPWPQLDPTINFQAHQDAVNGCSVNPKHPLLATCSGQRHFSIDILDDADDELDASTIDFNIEENALKLWALKLP